MLENISNYWKSVIGSPNTTSTSKGSQRMTRRQMIELNKLREILMIGLRFFHAGRRTESIMPCEQVLNYHLQYPTFRMVAACLLGETYRGLGDFVKAEQYYELSVSQSELIPQESRRGNEWYEHYRPRAQFGLITVMRRMLSDEHDEIKQTLKDTKQQYQDYPNADLLAQLNVVEGLYLRQLGEVESSIDSIQTGMDGIIEVAPPYLFLEPEHFEALLLLSYVPLPSYTLQALRLSKNIIKKEEGTWSSAVAYIGLLHLQYRRILSASYEITKKDINEISGWFYKLNENAAFEKDPLLMSEIMILQVIWSVIINDGEGIEELTEELMDYLEEHATTQIWLLRSLEMSSISGLLAENNYCSVDKLEWLLSKGRESLSKLTPQLKSYRCQQKLLDYWSKLLADVYTNSSLHEWDSEPLRLLRLRLWP